MGTRRKSQSPTSEKHGLPRLAIGLIGASTLLLEILLTRIFSVTMWYHFAFVAISLALFGIGASGVLVTVVPHYFRSKRALPQMGGAAFAMGMAVTVCFLIDLRIPLEPFDLPKGTEYVLKPYLLFFAKFLVLSLPFFFSGLVIALAFTHFPNDVHRTYFADLVGAGAGCVLVVPFLLLLSGPSAVIAVSALSFLSAALFLRQARRLGLARAALIASAVVLVFVGINERTGTVRITRVKSYSRESIQKDEAKTVYERWHPVSRVAVFPASFRSSPRGWFYSRQSQVRLPRTMPVTNDAGARTYLYEATSPETLRKVFSEDLSDLAYHITENPAVLVVGVGGGKDVLSGLAMGGSSVTAVELNPLMIEIVQDRFAEFTGAPYNDPRVHIAIDEGRNYIASRDKRYDLIKISVTDTWTASALGAYALTENYLYTVEAIKDFVSHLEPGGLLSIIRWYPQESLRLAALSATALREMGYENLEHRIVMVRNPFTMNLTIKNGTFTDEEIESLQAASHRAGLSWISGGTTPLYGQDKSKTKRLARQSHVDRYHRRAIRIIDLAELENALPFSIDPPTDDRPFFFSPVGVAGAREKTYFEFKSFTFQHGRALNLLIDLLKISVAIALAFVVAPLLLSRKRVMRGVEMGPRVWWSTYFLALGFGYLLIEIPMLQRFILFLGHPTYAVTVVLFSLLISSGVGSLLAGRWSIRPDQALRIVFPALLLLTLGFAAVAPSLLQPLIGLPFPVRVLTTVLFIVPLGFLLGIPFPVGMGELHRVAAPMVPWAWAVNGAASVAAPVIAMILGIVAGFSVAIYFGASMYVLAGLLLWARERGAPSGLPERLDQQQNG